MGQSSAMSSSGWFLSCLLLWLSLIETSHLYNLYNVNSYSPFILPSGGSYRDAETLEMSVKAGKLAKLLASRNYQQQQYQEYGRRNNQHNRYRSPQFYTSKGHVGGHKKNDQE